MVSSFTRAERNAIVQSLLLDGPEAGAIFEGDTTLAATYHFARFMEALGLDVTGDEHLRDTPGRVAEMYAELLAGDQSFSFTTFPADGATEMVLVRDIPFVSFCAHHFLPFTGTAHVAYLPGERLVGLSKLARTVHEFALRPQVQERLTSQIADALTERLDPRGVAVIVSARHECMELRGAKATGATTITPAFRGAFTEGAEHDRLRSLIEG